MSAAVLAMDPATWHSAREFRPERWLQGGASTLGEMSFGAGPRSYVGGQLAMVVAPIVVASILRDRPDPA
jgi:cytochrome P450